MPRSRSGRSAGKGSRRRPPRPGRRAAASGQRGSGAKSASGTKNTSGTRRAPEANDPTVSFGPLRLGAVPGSTPGGWIDTWHQRMPHNPLELVPLTAASGRGPLDEGEVDVALVRLPVNENTWHDDGLHVIRLYDEAPVVVMSVDSDLTAAEELTAEDLTGEVLITSADDVLAFTAPGTQAPRFAAPLTTEDAIELVATGIGILAAPMSLARLYHRKDVTYRPLHAGPVSTVALAWVADRTTPLIETFVGIVRGRTANSSR